VIAKQSLPGHFEYDNLTAFAPSDLLAEIDSNGSEVGRPENTVSVNVDLVHDIDAIVAN
jgi:hypothetical protein